MTAMQPQAHSTLARRGQQLPAGKNRANAAAVLLLAALCAGTPALAQDAPGPARSLMPQNSLIERQDDTDARTRISQREASDIARERFPGRVLSVRLENRHWRVRMDQEGTVFNVLVDAESGSASRAQD